MNRPLTFSSALFIFLLIALPASAAHRETVPVRILGSDGVELSRFDVSLDNWAGGLSVVVADLGTDGVPEILIGNGIGNEPRVRVLRQDGSEVGSFLAYEANMGVGINLAVCDLDGDGTKEIVTAPQKGALPHVRVFSNMGEVVHPGFFAYAESFREGVNLACGNVDADAKEELVTLPAAGGGPHVRVWKLEKDEIKISQQFFVFEESDRRGLIGVVHDQTLVVASSKGSSSDVKIFSLHPSAKVIHSQTFLHDESATGVVGLFEHNNIITMSIEESAKLVNTKTSASIHVEEISPRAASGDFDQDGTDELIVVPGKMMYRTLEEAQYIFVDLSDQQLSAYENGVLAHTFPISSGKYPWKTPVGIHSVLAKLPYVDYTWNYGAGNPNNYSLGLVPWNLRIYPHVYIHYAYWHNNFGHAMSHGCVNVPLDNMKWIYDFAHVGTPVEVRE